MVGSVLMQRMQDEGDFANINPVFFSTSNAGGAAPSLAGTAGGSAGKLEDAFDVEFPDDTHATSTGISNEKLAMWTYLASDCLLFGGLIWLRG